MRIYEFSAEACILFHPEVNRVTNKFMKGGRIGSKKELYFETGHSVDIGIIMCPLD